MKTILELKYKIATKEPGTDPNSHCVPDALNLMANAPEFDTEYLNSIVQDVRGNDNKIKKLL